jgi:hypothetical protein
MYSGLTTLAPEFDAALTRGSPSVCTSIQGIAWKLPSVA